MRITLDPSGQVVELPDEVAALASTYGSEMMDSSELTVLGASAALAPWTEDAIVVEIGAFTGRSSIFVARTLQLLGKRVPVLSIDPFERVTPDPGNPQGSYAAYLRNVQAAGVDDVCLPLCAFSRDAAPVVPARAGLLIVDGSHHYPAVSADLVLYAPKVLPGGLIFIDDYTVHYPGVRQAIDEFFTADQPFTILHQTYFVVAQRTA